MQRGFWLLVLQLPLCCDSTSVKEAIVAQCPASDGNPELGAREGGEQEEGSEFRGAEVTSTCREGN
ncbi:hypothetical protein EYF80_054004 [Liparis tanakae]|uniref:Uncharacterized protein n=1 Tax=Liparis tanakae TaxID=230148 RepID=A0A4Z2F5Q1_9TELE|nr:hypothetical protein EYF80_054004 [Liparis tanakae]